ncbi:NosD domain-containing protein [Methanohalophilus sp. WG1-DM]|jgi:parallel beta-helix repeat protein|uniref:NosD domain-containing protein n=1 Tax=Methanohalophilus sp. WG1-DM TaxID=2491675 RepID=UPI000FB93D07|nr:NosD domain-containing protein [Methanohalophilus sp. WG1-DM]RSD35049.1 MAG: periplasmic copper-binding protein [Methanohalophilus sp.]RXG35238.1 periplasmic copper-binding protein [Methanohalophilus sp. WG1-DM]
MQIKLLMASVIALTLLSSAAMAVEITVGDSGSGNYTTIQDAVNVANDTDTIIVYPGTYNENVDVNKSVIIISQSGNPDDTKVQAASSADYVFNVTRNNVTISGFDITNATGTSKAGIFLDGVQHNTISNNKFSKNYYAVFLNESRNNTLTRNIVSNSSSSGIQLVDSGSNTIYDNYFNNTINIKMSDSAGNSWNIKKTLGPNIVGGPSIGGNYWAHPDGTGHSETCTDADNDGFCGSSFYINDSDIDYLPLTISAAIDIEKHTNGEDADERYGPYIRWNYEVRWDFYISNTGNVNLTNVVVEDNKCGVMGTIPILMPGESVQFTETTSALLGLQKTKATATGTPTVGPDVMDYDRSYYFGHDSQPAFDIPTAQPLLTAGFLGIAVVMFMRRKRK